MRALMIKYSLYFNKKYHRVGPVFQGKFKGVMITSEPQFIFLSKYIHRNPITSSSELEVYPYSSYQNYLGKFHQDWIDISEILSYFSKSGLANSYKQFVEELDERDLVTIKNVVLEEV
jgi:hypothetical protein